jgi:hypothetical protein
MAMERGEEETRDRYGEDALDRSSAQVATPLFKQPMQDASPFFRR